MIERKVKDFEKEGYCIIPSFLDTKTIAECNKKLATRQAEILKFEGVNQRLYKDIFEFLPTLIQKGLLENRTLINICEGLIGPFVQLDSTVIIKNEPSDKNFFMIPTNWHRDRFAIFPNGKYIKPNTIMAIIYMQNLTNEVGPIRIIPKSHYKPIQISEEKKRAANPLEKIVKVKAGDVVLFHNSLLHSGTFNISQQERGFIGFAFNHTYMRTQDDFNKIEIDKLIKKAEKSHDYQILRLFGHDKFIESRLNSGFREPDKTRWKRWQNEEKKLKHT